MSYLSSINYELFIIFSMRGGIMRLRIRDLREDNDLTQKQVSGMLMCDQSLYSKYERGEREIPLALVVKLADFYGTSIDYIVGRTDNPKIYR